MPLLELLSEETRTLPEINGDYTWMVVANFRLTEPASSESYLAEMVDAVRSLTSDPFGSYSHGPYRIGALSAHNYSALAQSDAEASFGSWMADFCGPGTVDAEPIIEREIRPLLEGSELFILSGDYDGYEEQGASDDLADMRAHYETYVQIFADEHPTLDFDASILMGWIEVVAINRLTRTLTIVITSAD